MSIGARIKEIREKNNLSQAELAERIKTLNQSQICKIENDKRSVKVNELTDIANIFNISIMEIIT